MACLCTYPKDQVINLFVGVLEYKSKDKKTPYYELPDKLSKLAECGGKTGEKSIQGLIFAHEALLKFVARKADPTDIKDVLSTFYKVKEDRIKKLDFDSKIKGLIVRIFQKMDPKERGKHEKRLTKLALDYLKYRNIESEKDRCYYQSESNESGDDGIIR